MISRRFGAAALAAVTALSLNTGVANALTFDELKDGVAALEYLELVVKHGDGTMPPTKAAGDMAAGSIEAGSSGSQAFWTTQVAWGAVWTALAAGAAGVVYQGAVNAGLIKPVF